MTELFSDGFESGDFSAWTATAETPTVINTDQHHGSYCCEINSADEYIYKTVGDQNTIFVRAYIKFVSGVDPLSGNAEGFKCLAIQDGGLWLVGALIYNDAGTLKWAVRDRFPWDTHVSTVSVSSDTWVSVELKLLKDATSGEWRLYIDGTEVLNETALDTSGYTPDEVLLGDKTGSAECTIRGDCVVAADTYIGPEGAAPPKGNIVPLMLRLLP